jgi:hypothetical protein
MKKVNSLLAITTILIALFCHCKKEQYEKAPGKWIPPIGIPNPGFGIDETYRMYDDGAKRNSNLTYYQNEEGGYYTHYVDNLVQEATNTDNPYGTIDKPRISFPDAANVLPGSVIEVHGGPYTINYIIYTVNGTKEQPIFLRGYSETNRVLLREGDLYLNSQYLIFENFERTKAGIVVRSFESNEAHHVSVRNCDVHDCDEGIFATCWDEGKPANNIVIYKNHIHPDNFDPAAGEFPENDVVGVYLHFKSENIWVVDNIIHNASGDAVAGGHGAKYSAKNYYIGRNTMYTCGENAVDLKEVENIVVSQNIMYDFQGWSSGDNGIACITHKGPDFSPKNVWFLYNEIYGEMDGAIFIGGEQEYEVYIIGNVFHNITRPDGRARVFRTWDSKKIYFVNNTIYNCDNGFDSRIDGPDVEMHMYNNIISNIKPGGFHLFIGGTQQLAKSVFKNNLYYQTGSDVVLSMNGRGYSNIPDFYNATKLEEGSIIIDPLFVDPGNNDFRLQSNSPAIDKGLSFSLSDMYQSQFGVSINFDFEEKERPQYGLWDLGAFEYKE